MTRFTSINLSDLPAPEIIEELDVEAIYQRKKAQLIAAVPELASVLDIEAEPLNVYLQKNAYDELLLRAAKNDGAKSIMLAFATGANLEHLAAFYGVARLELAPANPDAVPPTDAVMESDSDLRGRIQLALEAQTSAGTIGSYRFFALAADSDVKDVAISQPVPGTVMVTLLSRTGDGAASPGLQTTVEEALNDEDVRPLCDTVQSQSATIITFDVQAELTFYDGPDQAVVLAAAQASLETYLEDRRLIGHDVTRSGIFAALHQTGVQNVTLTAPAADIVIDEISAGFCTGITLTNGGIDV